MPGIDRTARKKNGMCRHNELFSLELMAAPGRHVKNVCTANGVERGKDLPLIPVLFSSLKQRPAMFGKKEQHMKAVL